MKRIMFFVYGVVSYLLGFCTLLYLIAFLGGFGVPKTIDGTPELPLFIAMLINLSLVVIFGLQHSIMARPKFKEIWTHIVPKCIERSTYVLFTFFALGLLMYLWQPLGGQIWLINSSNSMYLIVYGLFFTGWLILFLSTFLINHFDLFGLRQVYLQLLKKEYVPLIFKERVFYKSVRHPIYTGVLMGLWFTPNMTVSHLFLAILFTAYVLYAITLEERDLINQWGEDYLDYKSRTGSLVPKFFGKRTAIRSRLMNSQAKPS